MSRYSGPQRRGAGKQARVEKRQQAEVRQREECHRDVLRAAGIYCSTSGHDWQTTECEECGGMRCYVYCADCPEELRYCQEAQR